MDAVCFKRDMSISHADFFRTLQSAIGPRPYQTDGNVIQIIEQQKKIEIRLAPETQRRIASLNLPNTMVEFRFEGHGAEEVRHFMENFDRCFQRGGG